eukprot:448888-Pelagomonas_calceolata.AAC.1
MFQEKGKPRVKAPLIPFTNAMSMSWSRGIEAQSALRERQEERCCGSEISQSHVSAFVQVHGLRQEREGKQKKDLQILRRCAHALQQEHDGTEGLVKEMGSTSDQSSCRYLCNVCLNRCAG